MTRVSYFRKCLTVGHFEEATSKHITLPEDEPTVFARVLEYIYFGRTPYELDDPAWNHLRDSIKTKDAEAFPGAVATLRGICLGLVKFYILADKLCVETLMNLVHDMYRKCYESLDILPVDLETMTDLGPRDGLMRQYALQQYAVRLHRSGWDRFRQSRPWLWKGYMASAENANEFLKIYAKFNTNLATKDAHDICRWHKHDEMPRCD